MLLGCRLIPTSAPLFASMLSSGRAMQNAHATPRDGCVGGVPAYDLGPGKRALTAATCPVPNHVCRADEQEGGQAV